MKFNVIARIQVKAEDFVEARKVVSRCLVDEQSWGEVMRDKQKIVGSQVEVVGYEISKHKAVRLGRGIYAAE